MSTKKQNEGKKLFLTIDLATGVEIIWFSVPFSLTGVSRKSSFLSCDTTEIISDVFSSIPPEISTVLERSKLVKRSISDLKQNNNIHHLYHQAEAMKENHKALQQHLQIGK